MITGQGVDIVNIQRISQAIERGGHAFLQRIYTDKEIAEAQTKNQSQIIYFAGRWAAKEALSKALGCGIGKNCSFKDIEVLSLSTGAPYITLSGNAQNSFNQIGGKNIFVSLSHEHDYAVAIVTLEK